jgi:hypothetical protein
MNVSDRTMQRQLQKWVGRGVVRVGRMLRVPASVWRQIYLEVFAGATPGEEKPPARFGPSLLVRRRKSAS